MGPEWALIAIGSVIGGSVLYAHLSSLAAACAAWGRPDEPDDDD